MKLCLYTLCDFKPMAIDCIVLLLKSIIFDIPTDFFILSNASTDKYSNYKNFTILSDESNSKYIGYMKYSPILPNGYDYYIYLDSDILYFDKISNLIDISKSFTIVTENCLINNSEWFYFPYLSDDKNEITKLQNSTALNAGSFCFRQDNRHIIQQIYDIYHSYKRNNINHDVRLEQTIFNLIINKESNYTLENYYNITDIVELFAGKKNPMPNKKLYHFCGFTNEMSSKFNLMKDFYDKYTRTNS